MRQLLNNPWVVLGLCFVAVLVMYVNGGDLTGSTVSRAPLTPKPLPVVSLTPLAKMTSEPQDTPTSTEKIQMDWPETVNRDPFAPVVSAKYASARWAMEEGEESYDERPGEGVEFQPPVLQLSAVSLEPKPHRAMINRKIVEVGDQIEGLRVSRIESNGVWFKGPSGPYHITFHVDHEIRSGTASRENSSNRGKGLSLENRRSIFES